ncbi:hypothetical protein KAU32_03445 [bacterium]|nr:hypothetical protein [bacterium]
MKKGILKGVLILVLLLVAGTASAAAKPRKTTDDINVRQSKMANKEVNIKKVKKYIKEMINFMEENTRFTSEGELDKNPVDYIDRKNEIEEKLALNEWEYLEIQHIMAKDIDFENYETWISKGETFDREQYLKLKVFDSAFSKPIRKYKGLFTKEEMMMLKIMPYIQYCHGIVKGFWIEELKSYLLDINNEQLPFSIENRTHISNELMKIFSNKQELIDTRSAAVRVWKTCEIREDKIYEGLELLTTRLDPRLLRENGYYLPGFIFKAPLLYDKMFNVLKNRKEYPEDILFGTLEFFSRSMLIKETLDDIMRIRRFEKELQKIKNEKWGKKIILLVNKELEIRKKNEKKLKLLEEKYRETNKR